MLFKKRFAKLILEGKKTLELRRFPPRKKIYSIQVGRYDNIMGYFVVKGYYTKDVRELTEEEIKRLGFTDREDLSGFVEEERLEGEQFLWEIERLPEEEAKKLVKRR